MLLEDTRPGYFEVHRYKKGDGRPKDYLYLYFNCPCGCGNQSAINLFQTAPGMTQEQKNALKKDVGGSHAWEWDGNEKQPTLTPSIQRNINCKWHGHLQKGVWVESGSPTPNSKIVYKGAP